MESTQKYVSEIEDMLIEIIQSEQGGKKVNKEP